MLLIHIENDCSIGIMIIIISFSMFRKRNYQEDHALTPRSFSVERYASICSRSSEALRPSNFWKPLDTPNGLFSLGVRGNTCFGIYRPDLNLSIK